MANKIQEQVELVLFEAGLNRESKLLLGISGGRDSVVLAHLLVQNGWNISLAHVNYQLRGNESAEDVRFVRQLAKQWQVELHIHIAEQVPKKANVQSWAREIRYTWFDGLLKLHAYAAILTAHHELDQAETILMALFKGRGTNAVQGIRAVDEHRVRPLLGTSAEHIVAYAAEHQLSWREDSSNLKDVYDRNFIRNRLAPIISSRFENWVSLVARQAKQWQQLQDFINAQCDALSVDFVEIRNENQHIWKLDLLDDLGHSAMFLSEFGRRYGGSQHEIEALLGLKHLQRGRRVSLGKWWVYHSAEGYELVQKVAQQDDEIYLEVTAPGTYRVSNVELQLGEEANSTDAEPFGVADLCLPLVLRPWQPGDKIQLTGMKGSKKVSDLLSECKLDVVSKKKQLVLCDQKRLLWVIGLRRSSFATKQTTTDGVWWIQVRYDR
ncbi:MAG: tRNA lysidine(34) synthetase TilS [Bacteroidia bacterium]